MEKTKNNSLIWKILCLILAVALIVVSVLFVQSGKKESQGESKPAQTQVEAQAELSL